jgi:hypothetical protein
MFCNKVLFFQSELSIFMPPKEGSSEKLIQYLAFLAIFFLVESAPLIKQTSSFRLRLREKVLEKK